MIVFAYCATLMVRLRDLGRRKSSTLQERSEQCLLSMHWMIFHASCTVAVDVSDAPGRYIEFPHPVVIGGLLSTIT
jgi:hypothetical protein